jgi:hypothetical protein
VAKYTAVLTRHPHGADDVVGGIMGLESITDFVSAIHRLSDILTSDPAFQLHFVTGHSAWTTSRMPRKAKK